MKLSGGFWAMKRLSRASQGNGKFGPAIRKTAVPEHSGAQRRRIPRLGERRLHVCWVWTACPEAALKQPDTTVAVHVGPTGAQR